jgi:hypothetical protein
VRNGD